MLEAAIPALWSAVHGWFTPAVFFVVLNIVIGTIAVTSKVSATGPAASSGEAEGDAAGAAWDQPRRLARVPSMAFDRLRSFNLRSLAAAAPDPEPEPEPAVAVDLGYAQEQQPQMPPAAEPEEEEAAQVAEREDEPLPELEPDEPEEHAAPHVERSRSAAAALPRLPARLHKSASDRSAFAHFGAEEVEAAVRAVEARRPATTRERAPVAEPEPEDSSDSEVDARADAFINRFHHQLKLQRIDSFIRHRETLRRGQAAAGAAV
ncbi:hypothetical protein BS78_10G169700 [Paspalum vaginatum]|nr:hypothetical protein BS78_10G169700 [Paspalum vaginatum]